MRQIRPIVREEADEFLSVLCRVFDLDFGRAASIFFHEPMFDLARKWALFDGGRIVSILTTVPLEFGWGRAVGIAGVATLQERQREGLARTLLQEVLSHGSRRDEAPALLFAKQQEVYRSVGFEPLGEVIRGPIEFCEEPACEVLEVPEVQTIYSAWSSAHPDRLRRDDRRWDYWRWNFRTCSRIPAGYMCQESGVVRECLGDLPPAAWPVQPGSEWLGLRNMADALRVPLQSSEVELHLMGYRFPSCPQMFMTDQF
jgi:GNAT superfamily N-acetyltransferase